MAYFSDLGTGAATFPGYVTHNWAVVCTNSTITPPIAYNATASKQALLKDNMKPTTATGLRFCAGTNPAVNKHKYTGGGAGWFPLCSLARPTAYTKSMKVAGGTMAVVASSRFVSGRFWMDAYDSAGIRQMSAGPVVVPSPTTKPGNMIGVFTSNQFVTVPVGGYLVARISCSGTTARLYYGPSGAVPALPAGATRTFYWNPTETAVGGGGAVVGYPVENRENFFDSLGNVLPDGTKVYEYDASTFAFTGRIGLIGGPPTGAGVAVGTASLFVAGTTSVTGITPTVASQFVSNNGDYTFSVVANAANFDLSVIKLVASGGTGVAQVFASINLAGTGLILSDGGLVFDIAGTFAGGTGGSFTITGAGVVNGSIAAVATGAGEVVFTRSSQDTGEYFYIIPDPASGSSWAPATTFAVGDKINPSSTAKLYAQVQSIAGTGTSGATIPVFPTVKDATIVDNVGVNQITWIMVEVETICTNAVKGYQLGAWVAGQSATIISPTTPATRIAPAGTGHYALATLLPGSNGSVTSFAGGTTGATAITVDTTSPVAALGMGDYTFTSNAAGDLTVTDVTNSVPQVYLAAAVAAGVMTKTNTGLIFNLAGTLVAGTGGTFTVAGYAAIVSAVPTTGSIVAGTTGITNVTVNVANVADIANNGVYTFTTNAGGDLTVTKGTGTPQTFLSGILAAGNLLITDGALAIDIVGTVLANGTGGSFSVGTGAAGTAGAVEPVWPTTIVSGTTTVADGNIVWTMYDNEVYV